jgi:tripartite-type tricarboxylate transporter receptor subunit TctC
MLPFLPFRALLGLALLAVPAIAMSADDDYPVRPVKIVVPFAPGGSTDVVARILADKLGTEFKQSFVVDNRSGASGNIGADAVAKAAPDGYTLLMGTTGVLSINAHLFKDLSYNPAKDFTPVSYTSLITNVLVVNPAVPVKSVQELIAAAKAKPGSLTFASSGSGSSTHLTGELFKAMAGVDILHIPYKGSSQALVDVISGQVTMLFDNAPSSIPFIQQGKLRALGVTSKARHAEPARRAHDLGIGRGRLRVALVERHRGARGDTQGDHREAECGDREDPEERRGTPEVRSARRRARGRPARRFRRAHPRREREVGQVDPIGQHHRQLTRITPRCRAGGARGSRGRPRRRR